MTPDVVVVGAGPVGMSAALFLASLGIRVTVLEAGDDLSVESRASTFHPPTLEMLDEAGLAETLISTGLIAPTIQWRDRKDGLVCEFDFSVLKNETSFPFRVQLEQSKFTRIIYEHLKNHPLVEVHFNSRVSSASEVENLNAVYVIVADGAHSAVRTSLGIEFEGVRYPDLYLVAITNFDFRIALHDLAYVNYLSDSEEWVALLATPSHWRATFPLQNMPSSSQILPSVQERLAKLFPENSIGIQEAFIYRVHQRIATTFRAGSHCLAGDAAHVNNPMGGLGMNSGIHDAYFLAKLLSKILNQEEQESSLDEYSRVRRAMVAEYVNQEANKNWQLLREPDEDRRRSELDRLRTIAQDPGASFRYVMRASMLQSARESASQLGVAGRLSV